MSHVVTAIEEVAVVGHDTATFSGKPYTRFRTQLTTNKGKTEHLIRYNNKKNTMLHHTPDGLQLHGMKAERQTHHRSLLEDRDM